MQNPAKILSNSSYFNLFFPRTAKINQIVNDKSTFMTITKYFFIISLLFLSAIGIWGQETYVFKDKSKTYDVKVGFEKCEIEDENTICNDKATFYLLKKNQPQVWQAIEMDETYLRLNGKKTKKGDSTELYGEDNLGVYFLDYNFDGIEDLVLSNGYYAPYGGISADVFLFSKATGKFVRDEELSKLETENMSVDVNKKLKFIETFTKSGCCWHEKARYRFVGNRLQKFYVFTEDATGDGKWMRLVTEKLVGGKWRKTTKRVLIKQYYKD